jgi:hypothetical protein
MIDDRDRKAAGGMTAVSARKLAANRANARASTGLRTVAGKARSGISAPRPASQALAEILN